jgi:hypothetical protein
VNQTISFFELLPYQYHLLQRHNPKSPILVLTLCLINDTKSYFEQPSKSPISYTLSIKSNSNFKDNKAASLISALNSGVFNSGFSSN